MKSLQPITIAPKVTHRMFSPGRQHSLIGPTTKRGSNRARAFKKPPVKVVKHT